MSVIKFSDATFPKATHLDQDSGHVFDANGNTIAKWEPADATKNMKQSGLMADYAADYSRMLTVDALAKADPERAKSALEGRNVALMSDAGIAHKMDLGPADVHVVSALPNYAAGYRNFTPMADVVSPPLLVGKQSDKYYTFDRLDAFQRALPATGANGGQVGEVSPRLATTQYTCVEKAMAGFVGTQLQANADVPLRILQATTKRIMAALLIERELRVQSAVRTTGNWNADQVTTLLAGSQWNGGASADPVKDIHGLIEASHGDVTGMLFPEKVFNAFVRNPAVRSYYAFKSNTAAVPSAAELSAILQIPPIYVARMKYINSAGSLANIWGNDVVLFRQPDEMPPTTQDDVATSYTFRWNVNPATSPNFPADAVSNGGFVVRQYFVQDRGSLGGMKAVVVHNDAEKITSKYVGGLIVNAYR
jgi:hypothetical protein